MTGTSTTQGFPFIESRFVNERGVLEIPWYNLLLSLWNRTGGSSGGGTIVPVGMVMMYAGGTVPDGYALCDGTEFLRSSDLFGAIGTTWGIGNGSTTANLPNLVDRMAIGAGGTYGVGNSGGSAAVTIDVTNLPAHSHGVTDPGHVHGQRVVNSAVDGVAGARGATAVNTTTAGTTVSATTGITINNTGGGVALTTISPYAALLFVVKL